MAQLKKPILIVDEEKGVGGTFETILGNFGFDIDYFTDPVLALEKFKPNLYDLTILDIKMPKINGFELYDQLKSRDSNIKTLFITALSSVESYNTHNSKVYPLKGQRHFMAKPARQVYSMIN
ncbi:MAG TPA: response regulator [Nitrososphaeraceae archaeon]